MTITSTQKAAIGEVIHAIVSEKSPRKKRVLSDMFLDLVDRAEWPQYYELIPEPRCLNNIRSSVEKNRYKNVLDAYTDLSLVFWNALFYNEPDSQISKDAETLKTLLDAEWKKRVELLSEPRGSPPPSAPQKVHATATATPASSQAPATTHATPAGNKPLAPVARAQPVPIRPRSLPPAEMDVDVSGMSPEPEGRAEDLGMRDEQSDEIVRQLEKGLPRWEGLGEQGWDEIDADRFEELVHAVQSHTDGVGNRLATALEVIPEESNLPNLSYHLPLSLKLIESRVQSKSYTTSMEFDMDMARLFEKGRRWHEPTTESYGHVLLLQRLYQALTSPSPPSGPPYSSTTNFASVRAGPGHAKPLHGNSSDSEGTAGVTTFRVPSKDRTFVDEAHYKGWSVKLADWLHLSNPDDPSRPIIAQVFRVWVSEEVTKKGQPGVTVCWYYRPEQTFHPSHRNFWEGEVFKTSHFADHPLPDLIEKIACQFTARHIRGRPRPPYWYPGWPLYVCDSRYNDRVREFVKIKNWNSCVPEEVRKSTEFMPIYLFERAVFPRRMDSPFLQNEGVKSSGGIDENVGRIAAEGEEGADGVAVGTGTGRKRTRRHVADQIGPNKGVYVGAQGGAGANAPVHPQPVYHPSQPILPRPQTFMEDRSVITAIGGMANVGNNVRAERLSPEITKHFDRDPDTNELLWFGGPPMNVARTPAPRHSLAYLHFVAMKWKKEKGGGNATEVEVEVEEEEEEGDDHRKKVKVSSETGTDDDVMAVDPTWYDIFPFEIWGSLIISSRRCLWAMTTARIASHRVRGGQHAHCIMASNLKHVRSVFMK